MRSDLLGAMSIPPVDTGVLGFVVDNRSGFWTALAYGLSWLGSTATLTVVTIAASAAFAVFRQWRSSAMILAGSWSAYVVMIVLKRAFDRDRPPAGDRLAHAAYQSMPSGHAMMSAVVFGLIAVALFRGSAWIREHPDVLLAAPVLSLAIGLSRVYLGVHWMTDVVAGWVLGALWITVVATVARLRHRRAAVPAPTG
ncbi:hypothetical protein GCM10010528_09770 [Gordonia defluvii]|jgi:undecaprenyl-diphosphatase|uniref:Phosphatidic acid phosphatase type 2/haloperoxidase domain-containing protein n=1 Tax=Gordonia defluvii TaxID=283718 RepID=A0ABP6L509_9ACTN|nr:phosphatase PAP2 family protein [Gordonia sp. UBA5067]